MPSYYMLQDADGRPLHIKHRKSEYEMQRLMGIGLNDEHYSPITNRQEEFFEIIAAITACSWALM